MPGPIIRPATREDIDAFSDLTNKPTTKAVVAELDGKIIALGGIATHQGRWYGFVDLTEEMRPHKMTIMRAAKRFLADSKRDGVKYIYAEVSPVEPRAEAWLTSLGFSLDLRSGRLYRWSGK